MTTTLTFLGAAGTVTGSKYLLTVDERRILIDAVDVSVAPLAKLRRSIALVSQETLLLDDTVLRNISYGVAEPDREWAEACLRDANAWGFVADLPEGLDSRIGEKGEMLSGGQRQRIALARALYRNAPVLLLEQDRARWDQLLIQRGLTALARAERLGGTYGPYTLQAAIAACHARAHTAAATDWPRIAALYDALAQLTPSPVVELNRAVALAMAYGPEVGLELVDLLVREPSLAEYPLLPNVRGDLLEKLGRVEEARAEFLRAVALTQNAQTRAVLLRRVEALDESQQN